MAYDVERIKASADLVALVGADVRLVKVATAEWAGPCPKCGGKDRLHVTAEWWFCRQCHDKRGDVIEYLCWRDGLAFRDACAALGATRGADLPRGPAPAPVAHPPAVATEKPGEGWQARARAFVEYAQGQLWASAEALAYLRGRGLDDDTIRAAGLGYNPKQRTDDAERWGLSGTRKVNVWAGWVIPCETGGVLQYVKVRQAPGREPRYICVRGSRKQGAIYGLDAIKGARDVILAEGEINALILAREIQGQAAVVSVGDAGNMPGAEALAVLATCRRWWLAFDPDKAGERGRDKLAKAYTRARVLSWPWDGDINDAYLAGENLADWALSQIRAADLEQKALAAQRRPPERAAQGQLLDVDARDVPETRDPDDADPWDYDAFGDSL